MPNHPTCKTCKWWARNRPGLSSEARASAPSKTAYVCLNVHLDHRRDDAKWDWTEPADCALAEECGAILVGPDFGCLHHPELNTDAIEDDANGG